MQNKVLTKKIIDTPLGPMIALATQEEIYLLEFQNSKNIAQKLSKLKEFQIVEGNTNTITSLSDELKKYFSGDLKKFDTPVKIDGTIFQKEAYEILTQIPYGTTKSYKEQAIALNKPKSFRAVANANALNQVAIVIPCHRVIGENQSLRGYAGGIERKKWLLEHEKKNCL